MSVCPRCGWNSPEGQSYCGACGCELKGAPSRPIAPPPPPGGQWSAMPPPPPESLQPPPVQPVQPGPPPPPFSQLPGAPPNYLVPAIVITVLCCVPLGIPAIIYANQVNTKWAAGDQDGARKASQNARLWMILAAVLGAFGTVAMVALMILGQAVK